jgi:GMP reductase
MKMLDFSDVLIKPGISDIPLTRADINITPNGYIPIIVANMVTSGTFEVARIASKRKILTFLSKEYTIDEYLTNLMDIDIKYVGITSGVRQRDIEKTLKVINLYPDLGYINVDIANVGANVQGMIGAIKLYKKHYSGKIVAGNVATVDLAVMLEKAGADIIKIGIGSGAACLTRTEVGVGVPQLSAVMEISKAVSCPVISDGGCVTSGDVCKAIAAGASFVMLGGMFSACKELAKPGDDFVEFYGLGSKKMYETFNPSDKEYRPVEGRTLKIPIDKSINDVFKQLEGALRSVCTYVGVDSIDKLSSKAQFIEVNHQVNMSLAKYDQL